MACRRLLRDYQALLRRAAAHGLGCQRLAYSSLPEDLQSTLSRAKFPARRSKPNAATSEAAAGEAGGGGGTAAAAAAGQQPATDAAKAVHVASPWMFPWERRQLQGGALRWWEKFYWGVFVVGISLILFNRLEWEKAPDPAVEERKRQLEEQRRKAARLVLAGRSVLVPWGTPDPFGGMEPREIEEFCKTVTDGADESDPFEGMTPEEIDEYVREHGAPTLAVGMQGRALH